MLQFIESTFPGQLYPMYAEKIAHNKFHLSPEVPGARVQGHASANSKLVKMRQVPVSNKMLAARNFASLVKNESTRVSSSVYAAVSLRLSACVPPQLVSNTEHNTSTPYLNTFLMVYRGHQSY